MNSTFLELLGLILYDLMARQDHSHEMGMAGTGYISISGIPAFKSNLTMLFL